LAMMSKRPTDNEIIDTLEGIIHFADGFTVYRRPGVLGTALEQWLNRAQSVIDRMRISTDD